MKSNSIRFPFSMIILTLTAILFCLTLAGCSDESKISESYDPNSPDVLYMTEAQQMAIFYSGELFPPDTLTWKLIRELHILRSQWGDSIPGVKTRFLTPWNPGSLHMAVDDETYSAILENRHETWNKLSRQFQLKIIRASEFFLTDGWRVTLQSDWQLHPCRLGERFVGFPGAMWIETGERPHPYPDFFVRMQDRMQVKYFFLLNDCGDVHRNYRYFIIEENSSQYLGIHFGCPQSFDTLIWQLPFDSAIARERFLRDSLETYRAPWVDTARQEFGRLLRAPQFNWTRPTK